MVSATPESAQYIKDFSLLRFRYIITFLSGGDTLGYKPKTKSRGGKGSRGGEFVACTIKQTPLAGGLGVTTPEGQVRC